MCAHRVVTERHNEYATKEDICELFTEDVNSLNLLCFLLTADHEQAEQCFVASLDDCIDGIVVCHNWVRSWARRVIVLNAIRMITPLANATDQMPSTIHLAEGSNRQRRFTHNTSFARVVALEDFERFVYVLSILERCSEQDCSGLLGASRKDVREARLRALQNIADSRASTTKLRPASINPTT
jgi:hypothetical protein